LDVGSLTAEVVMETLGITLIAALYGITMKVADLLNEHGLRLFRFDAIMFGLFWGGCGVALVLCAGDVVASALVAMNVAFIARERLDFKNHQIAATMIICAGILTSQVIPVQFATFFLVFLIFGGIKDYSHAQKLNGAWRLNDLMLYYPIPALVYGMATGEWLLFFVLLAYTVAYDVTKEIAKRHGYP
jgi:hypothetical protein